MKKPAEIIVIGGGIIGLSIALELSGRGATVQVLSRNPAEAATFAAAGMLAPRAEEIPPGALLDFCLFSRSLYRGWTQQLSNMTGLDTGYWECGIVAPRYHAVKQAGWRSRTQLQVHLDPMQLSPEVAGGFWFAEDGQVDNRALYRALQVAVAIAGIEVITDVDVQNFEHHGQQIDRLSTNQGFFQAGHYVLATGAWSGQVLPIPVRPRKGEMLALHVPEGQPMPLSTVLFGEDIYIVPRRQGRIVLGATNDNVGFQGGNTTEGVQGLLARAARLCPQLAVYDVQETWWGFRPTAPDDLPILGHSSFQNLTLATGHHRNGILLAPGTAQLVADQIISQANHQLLAHFSYQRFGDHINPEDLVTDDYATLR